MDLQETVRDAIVDELRRQAENSGGALTVRVGEDDTVVINGTVDLDDLIMVVAGSVAGGP